MDGTTDDICTLTALRLGAVARRLNALAEQQLAACGALSASEFEFLLALASVETGELPMGELARRAGLTSGGATRVADRMVAGGEILRRRCDRDRRVLWAGITPSGRRAVAVALEAYRLAAAELFAELPESEVALLDAALGRILAAVEQP